MKNIERAYKIGDKVKIKPLKQFAKAQFCNPSGKMDKYANKTMTITGVFDEVNYKDAYIMKEDDGKFVWYEDMIKCLKV